MVRRGAEITKCSSSTLTRISKTAVFTCVRVCVYLFVNVRVCVRVCARARVCVCVCVRASMRACVRVFVRERMYVLVQ